MFALALSLSVEPAFAEVASQCESGGALFTPALSIRPYRLLGEPVDASGAVKAGDPIEAIEPKVSMFNGIGASFSGCLGNYVSLGVFLAFDNIEFGEEVHIPVGFQFAFYPGAENRTVSLGVGFGFDTYGMVPEVTPTSSVDKTRTVGVAGLFSHPERAKESWVIYLLSVGFDLGS